jgi:hypothetical protein
MSVVVLEIQQVGMWREMRDPLEQRVRDLRRRELVGEVLANEPRKRLLLAQHVQTADDASRAVSQDEERNASSLAGADQGHKVGQIGHVIVEGFDMISLTVRLAVAAQIGSVDREPSWTSCCAGHSYMPLWAFHPWTTTMIARGSRWGGATSDGRGASLQPQQRRLLRPFAMGCLLCGWCLQ